MNSVRRLAKNCSCIFGIPAIHGGCTFGAALLLGACAAVPRPGYLARVEQLALLETFNADLLSHDSATLTLERWCAAHRMAEPARIVAQRERETAMDGGNAENAAAFLGQPANLRERLRIAPDEPLRHRRVKLACGAHVLSEADNWYVPARLTPDMNRRLDETDEPFGKVVQPLGFVRRTFAADLLWSPLAAGWEMQSAAARDASTPVPPHALLQHRAVLLDAQGLAFSLVVETYTSELFAFGAR